MKTLANISGNDLVGALKDTLATQCNVLIEIAEAVASALAAGRKLLLCGNGGSAADCQHIAAELVNRFRMERRPLPAIALTTDTSILTAIANDYSFDDVFVKQVQALGCQGDVLLGVSTSGSSENVVRALAEAKSMGILTVGLTGAEGSAMEAVCQCLLKVQSTDTPRIQEVHIFLGHVLCDMVERKVCGE